MNSIRNQVVEYCSFLVKFPIAALTISVGWVVTIVKTQHLSVVCWVLLSRNPTYDYNQVIDFSFLSSAEIIRLLIK